jgi:hypothetical protein
MAALSRHILVAVGFGETQFACRKQLVHQVLSGDPDPFRLLGGVVAVERRKRTIRLSGGIYRMRSEAGR